MTSFESEWHTAALSDVCDVAPRDAPLSADAPFVPMDAVTIGERWPSYHETRGTRAGVRAQAGDVLFARITPCLENGKLAQVPPDLERVGGSTEFIVVRPGNLVAACDLERLILANSGSHSLRWTSSGGSSNSSRTTCPASTPPTAGWRTACIG